MSSISEDIFVSRVPVSRVLYGTFDPASIIYLVAALPLRSSGGITTILAGRQRLYRKWMVSLQQAGFTV